jgi:hypothetical protein
MEDVKVSEANSEVLVFLNRNFPTRLSALEEAAKCIQREVLREQTHPSSNAHWKS